MAGPTAAKLDLVALLGSFRAEGAIFTTFTLSLSWFEVYLLRRLERNGARRIAVLADAEGVAMSLREGLARGPGLRYALEAIRLPKGTFHPKVALLWGHGRVLLAVGSGNLTLPGMQRSLECWDILVSGSGDVPDQAAFSREVAVGVDGFLAALREKLDAEAWSVRVIGEARGALREAMPDLPSRDDCWWLDSCTTAIGEQVAAIMGVAPRRLEFLAPFHDPAGVAVMDLARRTGVNALTVLYADDTTFPLSRARRAWPGAIDARQLVEEARPLHAKVYRWRAPNEAWILSGSANATGAALWSTDNVEACILRRGHASAWDDLLDGEPGVPTERQQSLIKAAAAPLRILHARASDRGVTVKLEVSGAPPASVRLAFLESGEPETYAWHPEGIQMPLPGDHDPLRPTPLRVEAEAELAGITARALAWVSFEAWLEASPSWRRMVSAWARLMRDEGDDEEEEVELLSVFAEEHARTMVVLGAPRAARSSTTEPRTAADLPVPVRLLELAALRENLPADHAAGALSATTVDAVLAAMRQAFHALDQEGPKGDAGGDDDEPAERRQGTLSPSTRDALDNFEQRFMEESRALQARPPSPSRVLAYAGLCIRIALRLRVRDADRPELLWRTADRWVRALLLPRAAGMPLLSVLGPPERDTPSEVLTLVAGLVAGLVWHREGGRLEGEADRIDQRTLLGIGPLREALATLRRFDASLIAGAALPPEIARRIPGASPDLANLLATASGQPAPSDRMRWLTSAAKKAEARVSLAALEEDATSEGFLELTEDEREVLREARKERPPAVAAPWQSECPACRGSLSAMARSRLTARTPARCPSMRCGRWLVPSEGA